MIGFNIFAQITEYSSFGGTYRQLRFNGYQFYEIGQKDDCTIWKCAGCSETASTMLIKGYEMLRLNDSKHTCGIQNPSLR